MIGRMRAAFAVAALVALTACGGTPATGDVAEPLETESVAPAEPTGAPPAETPAPQTPNTAPDDGNGRAANVSFVLSGTTTQADGSYSGSGAARFCGDAVYNLTGNLREFSFEFPLDGGGDQVRDVTFSADDLVPGASTDLFHIGVGVKTASGHQPPALVIDTAQAGSDDSGSARLVESAGTTTLTLDAADELGQSIQMTATCGPR
jgi:hypothetical protein